MTWIPRRRSRATTGSTCHLAGQPNDLGVRVREHGVRERALVARALAPDPLAVEVGVEAGASALDDDDGEAAGWELRGCDARHADLRSLEARLWGVDPGDAALDR